MTKQQTETPPGAESNGWRYDPSQQAWTAKIGPSRWLLIRGDFDDAPGFTPAQVA
jgi:hypothetical protein